MQYTLRNVPAELDRALRAKAAADGKSLNQVALEALARATGASSGVRRDLADVAGAWIEDPETEVVLSEQRRIDVDMW